MDTERAVDRLRYEIAELQERQIVFIIGSALSYPSVPNTEEMIFYFLEELGTSAEKVRRRIRDLEQSEQYMEAAQELRSRRGDSGLTKAIQNAVNRARIASPEDAPEDSLNIDPNGWEITKPHRMLAELYRHIPPQKRGPIFTTNFDPLIEAAFEAENISTSPLAVPGSAAFPIESILSRLPVIHLHGIWSNGATLSTGSQLAHERPNVEEMIRSYMNKSLVVAVGYGGWGDSFMRSIAKMLRHGYFSSLQTELMWLSHGKEHEIKYHPELSLMSGEAGINFYFNIDATEFLEQLNALLAGRVFEDNPNYRGWTLAPLKSRSSPASEHMLAFVQGAQPDWKVSSFLPMLSNTQKLIEVIDQEITSPTPRLIILTGPTGEGKSAALKQIGLHFRDRYQSSLVLYREMGAPRISAEWVEEISSRSDLSFILVDEADLVVRQIAESTKDSDFDLSSKMIWVLAMHSSMMRDKRVKKALDSLDYIEYEFSEMTSDDAVNLASCWIDSNLLPEEFSDCGIEEISAMIENASSSNHGKSLFGSILHLWEGEELIDRVNDLLNRIAKFHIGGVSYRHILCAVAVIQVVWDLDETEGKGISTAMLGELVRIRSMDVLQLVVEPLGREVGISRIGDRIYIRHANIAVAIYNILEDAGELQELVAELAKSGARLRFSGPVPVEGAVEAYRLCVKLNAELALVAARGAIKGAPYRLEPKVTYISVLRSEARLDTARHYAQMLFRHLQQNDDRLTKQRGFFVEWANVEHAMGHLDDALNLALKSISDDLEGFVRADTVAYAMSTICKCLRSLHYLNRDGARQMLGDSERILELLHQTEWSSGNYAKESHHDSLWSLMTSFKGGAVTVSGSYYSFQKLQSVLRSAIGFES